MIVPAAASAAVAHRGSINTLNQNMMIQSINAFKVSNNSIKEDDDESTENKKVNKKESSLEDIRISNEYRVKLIA
jgi:hypothetical protein